MLRGFSQEDPIYQEMARRRMALSEAQSIVVKLERDAAIWEECEITIEKYKLAELDRRRQWEAWNRVYHAVESYLTRPRSRPEIRSRTW